MMAGQDGEVKIDPGDIERRLAQRACVGRIDDAVPLLNEIEPPR